MVAKMLLGDPILFLRDKTGKVTAIRNICPHRAIPLSYGKFDGDEVECCYHGWRFDCSGQCTAIPSLTGNESIAVEKIQVKNYEIHEAQGAIWIFMPDSKIQSADKPRPPQLPEIAVSGKPLLTEIMEFPCFIDHAVVGLMDPAHGPFVHTSWWWRSRKSIHEKAKAFGASHLGFTMLRHRPSSNSFAYKLLGGKPETEISFQLPGIRIEHISIGKEYVVNLTTVTPLDSQRTEITHSIYASFGWLRLAKPIVRFFARRFLGQDMAVVVKQQEGLRHERNLLLIRDADIQARWYYQLKNEYSRAQSDDRQFQNPVKETVLRWRS